MVITDTSGGGAAVFFSSVHPARWNALLNMARIKIHLPFTLPPLLANIYANQYRFHLKPALPLLTRKTTLLNKYQVVIPIPIGISDGDQYLALFPGA
jgi:hypothetical protein